MIYDEMSMQRNKRVFGDTLMISSPNMLKFIKSLRYTTLDEIDDQVFIEIVEQAYTYRKEKVINR